MHTLRPLLLWIALSAPSLAFAQEEESELYLADMGVTATLPDGWTVPRWSDWDLDAVDRRETAQVHVSYTPYQVVIDEGAAKAWAELTRKTLEEKHKEVVVRRARVVENRGRPCADIELSYRYEGQQPAVLFQRSFAIDGKVVHITATSLSRNHRRAEEALDQWDAALSPKAAAQDLGALPVVAESKTGFSAQTPPGWRLPLPSEMKLVTAYAASVAQVVDTERCWVMTRPHPEGSADMLLACDYGYYTGVVDDYSAEAVEQDLREHLFKGLVQEPGLPLKAGPDERVGFLYTLPDLGDNTLRMGAVPYNLGYMLVWGAGAKDHAADLEAAIRSTLTSTRFSDPEGAAHPVGVIEVADYYVSHRPSSPLVWGPPALLLALVGSLVVASRKRKADLESDL